MSAIDELKRLQADVAGWKAAIEQDEKLAEDPQVEMRLKRAASAIDTLRGRAVAAAEENLRAAEASVQRAKKELAELRKATKEAAA